ncbi:MAG TPA: hypothetical protein VMI12_13985 [Puia sp.]|nr:hypothetical protein [Puia sp.]
MSGFLLFTFYFIILLAVIHFFVKRKIYSFSFWQTSAIFSYKIILGCLYGYIFLKYYHGDDTWNFFNDSLPEYDKLIHNPASFFKDLLPGNSFNQAVGFREALDIYMSHLEYFFMVKLLAVFNIFSGRNYYIDVLFFNFISCWGPFLLFKFLLQEFPDKKNALFICIFFIPSISFWLSGIRGDGLLFLFIVFILYYSKKWFIQKKVFYFIFIIIGFAGFVIFRFQFLLVFLPAFFSWTISINALRKASYYFILVYITAICIFLGSILFLPKSNLAAPLMKRQKEFSELHGNTRFKLDTLENSVTSFIKILPQAFSNTMVRPLFWEAKGILQYAASFEIMMGWIILIFLITRHEKNWKRSINSPIILLFIFYGLTQILLIGYIVPFPGAIVRYKVIPELFLLISSTILINWSKKANKL